jgi:hypothetical protein
VRTFRQGPHYKSAAGILDPKAKSLEKSILDADFFYADRSQQEALSRIVAPTEVGMLFDS